MQFQENFEVSDDELWFRKYLMVVRWRGGRDVKALKSAAFT